jgi:hypothetical protein
MRLGTAASVRRAHQRASPFRLSARLRHGEPRVLLRASCSSRRGAMRATETASWPQRRCPCLLPSGSRASRGSCLCSPCNRCGGVALVLLVGSETLPGNAGDARVRPTAGLHHAVDRDIRGGRQLHGRRSLLGRTLLRPMRSLRRSGHIERRPNQPSLHPPMTGSHTRRIGSRGHTNQPHSRRTT